MSSSSYDSEGEDYWQYDTGYNTSYRDAFGRNPFYTTMGHPLIYYTEVPQPICMQQCGRERRRDNPNCFVKAFRWYTQEHVPTRSVSPTKPDMAGFAIWLDTKYDQFIQENRIEQDMYRINVKQTSVIQTNRIINNDYCEPCAATKRFRVKSPWKKKRRAKSNETCCNERQKSNQSFQYIMQPKDSSRPVSECCHPSNATVLSEMPKKTVVKSRSFSNITVVKSMEHIEILPAPQVVQAKRSVCGNSACQNVEAKINEKVEAPATNKPVTQDFCCQYAENKSLKNVGTQYDVKDSAATLKTLSSHRSEAIIECACQPPENKAKKPKASKYRDVECQCPEERLVQSNVQTQYEIHEKCPSYAFHDVRCECDFREFLRNNPPPVQSSSKVNSMCSCERPVEGELLQKPVVKFSQRTAQTSNHSIRLDKEAVNEYPLFLKIVCADKLSEDNVK